MKHGDAEGALFSICAALEETARRERLPKGRQGFKSFIANNIHIISGIGLGHPIAGLKIGYSHPDLPLSSDGSARFEDIVYHLIRCGLYHEAALPASVCLTENRIGSDNGMLLLPKTLVIGIIVAVVSSPGNVREKTDPSFYVTAIGENFFLNELWGQRAEVVRRVLNAAQKRDAANHLASGAEPTVVGDAAR